MGYDGLAHLPEPADGGDQNISRKKRKRKKNHCCSALVYIFSNSKQSGLTALSEEQCSRVHPDRRDKREGGRQNMHFKTHEIAAKKQLNIFVMVFTGTDESMRRGWNKRREV